MQPPLRSLDYTVAQVIYFSCGVLILSGKFRISPHAFNTDHPHYQISLRPKKCVKHGFQAPLGLLIETCPLHRLACSTWNCLVVFTLHPLCLAGIEPRHEDQNPT